MKIFFKLPITADINQTWKQDLRNVKKYHSVKFPDSCFINKIITLRYPQVQLLAYKYKCI